MIKRCCLTVIACAAALLVAAPGALALPDMETDVALPRALPFTYNCNGDDPFSNGYGVGCFHVDGDDIRIADGVKDSRSVGIYWQLATTSDFTDIYRRGICLDRDGAGNTWYHCNKDFAEGRWVRLKLGRCDGTYENCWYTDGYTDWTGWRVVHNVN
jgi:hypothetical protein